MFSILQSNKQSSFKLLLILFFVLLFGIILSILGIFQADKISKKSLIERTEMISATIDIDKLSTLTGTISDAGSDNYIEIKNILSNIVKVDPDIHFVYLTGIRDNQVFFYADSEPEDSEDSSPAGQIYDEASDIFKSVFSEEISKVEGPTRDRWGNWISALSPVVNKNGEVIASIGFDINANDYFKTIVLYASIPFLLSIILSAFIYFIYKAKREEESILEMKSELVSIAAHDLRTPLVGIGWSIDTILDDKESKISENEKSILNSIRIASKKILRTANEILESAKLEKKNKDALDIKDADISEAINDIIEVFRIPANEKSLRIITNNFPSSVFAKCDILKVKRVLSNLISNAIKYSKNNTDILLNYSSDPKYHIISVKDTGIGIPESDQKDIFKEYFRSKSASNTIYGSGLGLYYVKKVIELHNGKVWFESKENIGTVFYISLPK